MERSTSSLPRRSRNSGPGGKDYKVTCHKGMSTSSFPLAHTEVTSVGVLRCIWRRRWGDGRTPARGSRTGSLLRYLHYRGGTEDFVSPGPGEEVEGSHCVLER